MFRSSLLYIGVAFCIVTCCILSVSCAHEVYRCAIRTANVDYADSVIFNFHGHTKQFMVPMHELTEYYHIEKYVYVGSDSHYHFFVAFDKLSKESECLVNLALPKSSVVVYDEVYRPSGLISPNRHISEINGGLFVLGVGLYQNLYKDTTFINDLRFKERAIRWMDSTNHVTDLK